MFLFLLPFLILFLLYFSLFFFSYFFSISLPPYFFFAHSFSSYPHSFFFFFFDSLRFLFCRTSSSLLFLRIHILSSIPFLYFFVLPLSFIFSSIPFSRYFFISSSSPSSFSLLPPLPSPRDIREDSYRFALSAPDQNPTFNPRTFPSSLWEVGLIVKRILDRDDVRLLLKC